ncbi:glycosyltransferase family 39 protein [Frigidibacter sp. MR17.24]|uniref:glycosyltransferase family 39 protein n=1 Tax=Frigidibacter sp. MR17.24 TaxID=3127345 RepID=UPI003012E48A
MTDTRFDRRFLLAVALYFLAQVALRTALGGTFEPDEAEMVLLGRTLHLAEGSQTPLYEWSQFLSFRIFGLGTLGLVAVKNLWLFVAYAAMYRALRRAAEPALAACGTVAMLMLPNLGWEAQRSNSHTIAMVTLACATVWALARLAERRGLRDFLLLGLVVGLGGLAKPNYWAVPAALGLAMALSRSWRGLLADRRMAGAGLVVLAVIALPYAKLLASPETTFEDTWEFAKGDLLVPALPFVNGLVRLLRETVAGLVLPALVLGLAAAASRRRPVALPFERLMLAAGGLGLGIVALVIVAGDVAFVRSRWLLPLFLLIAPAAAVAVLRPAGARLRRGVLAAAGVLACLVLVAIADLRLRGAGSDSLEIGRLAEAIEAAEPGGVPPLVGNHYYLGNLALARPGWTFLPPYSTRRLAEPPPEVLLVDVDDSPGAIARALAEHGWTAPAEVTGRIEADLPYRFEDPGTTRHVTVLRVAPVGG